MEFEWDEAKARSNLKKHGIPFSYAARVFGDPMRYERPELSMDDGEERWSVTGLVNQQELLVVFTFRGAKTRIISARKAAPDERRDYWQQDR